MMIIMSKQLSNKELREGAAKLAGAYLAAFTARYPQAHVDVHVKVRNGAAFFRVPIEGDDGGRELSAFDMAEAIAGFTRGRVS